DGPHAGRGGQCHGDGHPAVLERAGRIRSLALQPDLRADTLRDALGEYERRRALAEGDDRRAVLDRQPVAVALDQRGHPRSVTTRITSGSPCTSGRWASAAAAARTEPAG